MRAHKGRISIHRRLLILPRMSLTLAWKINQPTWDSVVQSLYIELWPVVLGNNDRAARVLFAKHPREQGELCSQNPSVERVLTLSFALLPRVLDEQHPSKPVNIPIITRN